MSRINKQDAEEFTQSLGQIIGGSWRQIALAKRLGVPQALGLSTETWVRERLGGYVRLTVDERREAVRELAGEGMSQRGIGEVLGVDEKTIRNDQTGAEFSALNSGKSSETNMIDRSDAENSAAVSPLDAVALLAADEKVKAMARAAHVANNSGNNEWYTPGEIIEAARTALGGIDLDPAYSEVANRTVQAARFFTAADDGLAQEWPVGRIWMNPPYAQPLIGRFADRMAAEVRRGSSAVVLVNNATETTWFQVLAAECSAICFPRGRVRFLDPGGDPSGVPLQGQAVIYAGAEPGAFAEAFDRFGFLVPAGRRLDMFNRRAIDGFDGWGNEAATSDVA